MLGDEGQHTALAIDGQAIRVGDDLNRVNLSTCKTIHRVEHLERADQIELIHRRHDGDDNPAARARRTAIRVRFL